MVCEGAVELPLAQHVEATRQTELADQECRVNFRWGSAQLAVVRRVAMLMGVPYQQYIKQVLFRQAYADLQRFTALGFKEASNTAHEKESIKIDGPPAACAPTALQGRRLKSIVLTTKPDLMGHVFSRDTLEKFAREMNESAVVKENFVDHDHILPPIGKGLSCSVSEFEAGEYALWVEFETFGKREAITLSNGLSLMKQSTEDKRAFQSARTKDFPANELVIAIEERSFPNPQAKQQFIEGLNRMEKVAVRTDRAKSADLVDPNILILVSAWFLTKVDEKLTDKGATAYADTLKSDFIGIKDFGADKLERLSEIIREAMKQRMLHTVTTQKQPILRVQLETDPTIELVYVGDDTSWTALGLSEDSLRPVFELAAPLKKEHGAGFIQFHFNKSTNWELSFAETQTGDVISTDKYLDVRDQRFLDYQKQCTETGEQVMGISATLTNTRLERHDISNEPNH